MAESLQEPVQEDLGFPLLIPLDVRPDETKFASRFARSVSIVGLPLRGEGSFSAWFLSVTGLNHVYVGSISLQYMLEFLAICSYCSDSLV
jgi:hypothetical protein